MYSSDTSGLQCIVILVILGIAGAVLWGIASRSKNASPVSQTLKTSLPREQIVKLIEKALPKSIVTSSFNWKLSWPTSDTLLLSGYYLTNGQSCLVLILTGIIPGALLIWLLMGQSEKIKIDFSKLQSTGELVLEAQGLRAQQEADKLVDRIRAGGQL